MLTLPHLLSAALVLWMAATFIYLLREQRKRADFTLIDLVTGDNGRASLSKFAMCGAFFVSTWGFVYLTVGDKLTEWYFGAYMLAWTGTTLVNKAMSRESVQ